MSVNIFDQFDNDPDYIPAQQSQIPQQPKNIFDQFDNDPDAQISEISPPADDRWLPTRLYNYAKGDKAAGGRNLSQVFKKWGEDGYKRRVRAKGGISDQIIHGATMNFDDEIAGGLSGGVHAVGSALKSLSNFERPSLNKMGNAFTQAYGRTRARYKKRITSAREENGIWPEIAGGFLTPMGAVDKVGKLGTMVGAARTGKTTSQNMRAAKIALAVKNAKPSLVQSVKKGVGVGAGYGAVAGIGDGDGLQDRLSKGVTGGMAGAILGGGFGAAGHGVGKIAPYVSKGFKIAKNKIAPREADGYAHLGRYSDDFGGLEKQWEAGQTAKKMTGNSYAELPEMLADLSPQLGQLGRTVTTISPKARNLGEKELKGRMWGQKERLIDQDGRTLGISSKQGFHAKASTISKKRAKEAETMYQRAYSEAVPFDITDNVLEMNKLTNGPEQYIAKSPEFNVVKRALSNFLHTTREIEGRIVVTNLKMFNRAKMLLDEDIAKAQNFGDNVLARELTTLRVKLLEKSDKVNPLYVDARNTFTSSSAVEDAMKMGRNYHLRDHEELQTAVNTMNKAELEGLRTGALRQREKQRGVKKRGQDFTSPVRTENIESNFRVLIPSSKQSKIDRPLNHYELQSREAQFKNTENTVLGGSQTDRNLADAGRFSINSGVRGNYKDVAFDYVAKQFERLLLLNEKDALATAKILFETDPAKIRRHFQILKLNHGAKKAREIEALANQLQEKIVADFQRVGGVAARQGETE